MSESVQILCGDNLELMRAMEPDSVDLVVCSPPYDAARSYDEVAFDKEGEAWVEWAKPRFRECLRVCKGLVVWVVDGQTDDFRYSCSPFLLMADLHREGFGFRHPAVYHRIGIPGSGGPDWLRNDWEPVLCASKGRLPWSDNTACGHPPKWAPGGEMANRLSNGARVNQWGPVGGANGMGKRFGSKTERPSHVNTKNVRVAKRHTKSRADGTDEVQIYTPPAIANPGNVIKGSVGGGALGSPHAHDNEAPYPEWLVEFFVKSFCPPNGTVMDIFTGSGTTAKVALKWGRNAIAIDIRESQCELTRKRIALESPALFTNGESRPVVKAEGEVMCEIVTKCKPMLFSGPMVTACLREEHPKTQTRRIVTPANSTVDGHGGAAGWRGLDLEAATAQDKASIMVAMVGREAAPIDIHLRVPRVSEGSFHRVRPRWEAGDVLWGRETCWHSDEAGTPFVYRADSEERPRPDSRWRPAIHMPRRACRLYLNVVSVRAERVQDISDEDAIAEGVEAYPAVAHIHGPPSVWVKRYAALWDSINGKGSWAKNPWVWVITFKHCKAMEASR